FCADARGRIWIGTDGGLSRYEPASDAFIQYDLRPSESSTREVRVRAIREDHEGMLWVGTLDSGVVRLEPETHRFTSFRHDPQIKDSLSNDRVLAILEDDARRLWFASAD